MKKIIVLLDIVLTLAFFIGCGIKNSNIGDTPTPSNTATPINTSTPASEALQIQEYFPINENTRYVYEGKGNEYASYDVYIDYISENKIQQRVNNGGTVMANVVELKAGKLTMLSSREEAYYRENLLEIKGDEEEILLMEPLVKGTSWTLKDSRVRTITSLSVDITTPKGSYKAIEVTTQGQNDETIDYYAKNVGLVKSVFTSGETEVTSSLSKIEEDVSLLQKINFYYPNINDEKIYFESKKISFKTNDVTNQVLEEAYKSITNNAIGGVFTTNTKINSLYLNKDKIVYINLNSTFLTEMNAGASYEQMILQSIANTFGQYYNAEKVMLTIDNKPYESGHINMGIGESLIVNTENTVEIKK